MSPTEKHEEPFIEAYIEAERQPSGEPEKKVGKIMLEGTDLAQQQFDATSNHFYEWE
jgi:hypothetical protein